MTSTTDGVSQAVAARAADQGLILVGGRPRLGRYLAKLWETRHFSIELARSRFRAQNEEDRLGVLWNVIGPLLNAAVYGLIFSVLLKSTSRPHNFVPYLVTGVFIFQFFSACFAAGAKAIIGNMGLVRSLHFPRAVLPISVVLQQVYTLIPMIAVLAVLVVISGEPVRPQWLLVVPALLLMSIFNAGVVFISARLTIHVRDLAQLIPFITRIMFYLSGIFYKIETTFSAHPLLGAILAKNPVYCYIALVRQQLVTEDKDKDGKLQPWATIHTWEIGAIWAVATVVIGFIYFWLAEERYGRE